jgi:hypothetical protein
MTDRRAIAVALVAIGAGWVALTAVVRWIILL